MSGFRCQVSGVTWWGWRLGARGWGRKGRCQETGVGASTGIQQKLRLTPGSRLLNPDSCSSLLLTPSRTVIGYKCEPMNDAATRRGKGVRDRRGGGGRYAENTKKILNSGNKPKESLKIHDLAFSGAKNEPETNPISSAKNCDQSGKTGVRRRVSGVSG